MAKIKNKAIKINFHKKLYSTEAIKTAIQEYSDLADFSCEEGQDYLEVEIKNIKKEVEKIIKNEFCNYVLYRQTKKI